MNTLIFSFFILGLIIGSFLNVLVYRLRDAETLLGRSLCRHCQHQIRWYDNIPLISFVLLRGTCRDCETRISWQYPLVELLTGVLFAVVGALFLISGSALEWLEVLWLLGIVSMLMVIAAYDLRYMEIPLTVLVASGVITAVFLAALWWFVPEPFFASRLWYGLLGGAAVGGFFFLLVWMSRETWMGWGDVWLGAVVGAVVGVHLALPMLTLSFGLGATVGLLAIARKKKALKSQIPFAPFLVIGTLASLFLSEAFPLFFRFYIW